MIIVITPIFFEETIAYLIQKCSYLYGTKYFFALRRLGHH
jgi:hypothetical protein